MSRFFYDPVDEDTAITAVQAERQRIATAPVTRDLAERMAALRRYAPHMPPGAIASLAQAGIEPGSPEAEAAARGAAKRKKKKGFGFHSFGDVVSAAGGAVGNVLEDVGDVATDVLKPTARYGFAVLQAPYEVGQGAFRNTVTGNWGISPFAQTTFGQLARGKSLGSGYLPGGSAAEAQAEVARKVGTIGGSAVTPGRWLANLVSEPGTESYKWLSGLTDAAAAIVADPASVGLGQAGKALKARKLLTPQTRGAVGFVHGIRNTTAASRVQEWVTSPAGREVVSYLAGETDPVEMWRKLGKKVDLETVRDLARTSDEQQVLDILHPKLGIDIREKPTLGGVGYQVRKHFSGVRLAQQVPGSHADLDDLNDVAEQMERFMRNARIPEEVQQRRLSELINTTDRIGRYNVVDEILSDTFDILSGESKQSKQVARRMTRMFRDYREELARYFVDEIGNNVPVLGAVVDDVDRVLPTPHLYDEYIARALPLPDAREIRRVTSDWAPIFNNPVMTEFVTPALSFLTQNVWKPLVLLRGAWTVRVVGEEQVRMASAGSTSLFRHPMSHLAFVLGRKGGEDILGETFDDSVEQFSQAMSRRGGAWRDRRIVAGKRLVDRMDEEYAKSWGEELLQLEADPVARRVVGRGTTSANPVEDAKVWFWEQQGRKFREEMAQARGREVLLTRAGSDAYVDTVFERIRIKTAEQPELLDALRTGRLNGVALRDGHRPARDFIERLDSLADEEIGPATVKGDIAFAPRDTNAQRAGATMDKAIDWMFHNLMSRPTNRLSRSPEFRQAYYRRIEELIPFMDEATQRQAIEAAAGTFTPTSRELKGLARATERGAGDINDLAKVDTLAKAHALDSTKKLLYDLHNRSQFFDATRLIFPFGEAWKEIATTWTRIGFVEGAGKPIRRAQQIIEGARGAGFFYTDPQTGEEVFNYPLSGRLADALIGIPVPLQGSVSGLNLVGTSVLPGVGPVVQIPASKLIPNKPEWDVVRDLVLPFGDVDLKGGIVESQFPAWMRRLKNFNATPESDRMFANTVKDTMSYLVSTGDYTIDSPEAMNAVFAKATSLARKMYVLRGVVQYFAPTAPRPVFTDADGAFAAVIREDFRQMEEEDYDSAVQRFLEKYGENALMFMQSKTRALVQVPVTEDANDWIRRNPDIRRNYPLVYGMFAPDTGEFDYTAYERQLQSGERESLSPEQFAKLANVRVARTLYEQAKKQAGTSQEDKAWLAEVREALEQDYPGFGESIGLRERAELPQVIEQLAVAVRDPKLADTPMAQGISKYLDAREWALTAAQDLGVKSFTTAKRARAIRDWLRAVGDALSEDYEGFGRVWEQVFEREMTVDEEQEVAA